MKLVYHKKTFDLLQIEPRFSKENSMLLDTLEKKYSFPLAPSIREWYSINNHHNILQEQINCTINHCLITFEQGFRWLEQDINNFLVLEENQGCWHMSVKSLNLDDPPVYFCWNEDNQDWELHAKSFSDWIYAIAWDGRTYPNFKSPQNEQELSKFITEASNLGPETYHTNMGINASRFVRGVHNGQRQTVIV
jgi:hypothetical protein